MIPDSRLDLYAHSSNEPLPEHLHLPLNTFLDQLDKQGQACKGDRQRVEDAIEDRQSRIQALENEIECLKVVKKRLLTSETAISAKRTPYAATKSAVRRTPHEIIARIIASAISDPKGVVGKAERRIFQHLRAVCRLWRETALSTPYLWRSVEVDGDDLPSSVTSWCSRGGEGAPLTLSFSRMLAAEVSVAFETIRSSKLNVTSAIVTIDRGSNEYGGSDELSFLAPSDEEHPTSNSSGTKLPLKHIEIQLQRPKHWETTRSPEWTILTHHLPHLSTMLLSFDMGAANALCPASLIHTTLSTLSLRRIQLTAEVGFVVAGFPRLETLRLIRCKSSPPDPIHDIDPPYVHRNIKQAEVHYGIPEAFLSRLACPSLVTLVADGQAGINRERELGVLREFMERCGGPIQCSLYGQSSEYRGFVAC
ncbi:hypothetical protein BKA70DRAFT_1352829 [Coprinopsis sp. MPI-PUGE-AT-0042]|nr:hypothetical protein BKA70DRAFT_1352829 [Coprinopsis sp. MPI-PUGE-AT-0042]